MMADYISRQAANDGITATGTGCLPAWAVNRTADDLISRQAAIDAMGSINDSICEQQAIDALYALPSAQPEQRWIPVSERLPETPIRVQVQSDNGWIITAYYDEGKWYAVPDMYWGEPLEGVLAWMPLPKPWRNEQDD